MAAGAISPSGVPAVRHVVLEARPGQEHASIPGHSLEEKNVEEKIKKPKVVLK
jgi:hypothetical protein